VYVRDAMSTTILTIGPTHTLRQAARLMAERHVGAAVVLDPDANGPGILTERDVLEAVAAGQDAVTAMPDWDLGRAAGVMMHGRFRHLVVCEGSEVIGVLSVRDIVRVFSDSGQLTTA
jgi:CBS domain-containing protein